MQPIDKSGGKNPNFRCSRRLSAPPTMMLATYLMTSKTYQRTTILITTIFASAICHAAGVLPFLNQDIGFSLEYPSGWEISSKKSPTADSFLFLEPKGLNYGCMLTAYRIKTDAPQDAISAAVFKSPLSAEEWKTILSSDGYKDLQIISVTQSTLGGLPGNRVEFTANQLRNGKRFYGHYSISTSLSTLRVWRMSCSAVTFNPTLANRYYADSNKYLETLRDSFRVLEPKH